MFESHVHLADMWAQKIEENIKVLLEGAWTKKRVMEVKIGGQTFH